MEKNKFEKVLKPFLLWMGTIVASIMAIAYIIVVFVLIEGFKVEELLNTTVFAIITAIVGFCIMQMLKIQGQTFASNLEENQPIIKAYNETKVSQMAQKRPKSLTYFWITSIVGDVFIKCLTLAISSIGMIYIMIKGSGDYNLLFLAVVNLLMFGGFGLISLVKAYDFYNNEYVPYMQFIINETNKGENKCLQLTEKNLET